MTNSQSTSPAAALTHARGIAAVAIIDGARESVRVINYPELLEGEPVARCVLRGALFYVLAANVIVGV